jgi:uncharacterized RDD family membrane protein YckC
VTIQVVAFVALIFAAVGVQRFFPVGPTLGTIISITGAFLLFWGYYLIFEWLWAGRTPGKRLVRIRVVDMNGTPIGFTQSLIRNLIRIVDFLPSAYGVGLVAMFSNARARRLGDFAAGTLVVKERSVKADILPAAPIPTSGPFVITHAVGQGDPEELTWAIGALLPGDIALMVEFLNRAPALPSAARRRLALGIAERVRERIGAREPLDPVRFIERVADLSREGSS